LLSLVVPTYKERSNIEQLVKRTGVALAATGEAFELIIVDDSSPDGTAKEVRRLQVGNPWLRLIERQNDRDLSTAVLTGWKAAQGEIFGCMDGDLQHPPEHIPQLIQPLFESGVEIAIASRYVPMGGVSDWKFRRRIVSWIATALARTLLTAKVRRVRDPMSGFFFMRRSVLDGVTLRPRGYKILLEVLARGRYEHTAEVPYRFEERQSGGSKMGVKQLWQYLVHLLHIRFFPS
jgi:dolichol-phosphate mannosyltransferase